LSWYGSCEEDGQGGYRSLDKHESKEKTSAGNWNFDDEGVDDAISQGEETGRNHDLSKKKPCSGVSRDEQLFGNEEEEYEDVEEKKMRLQNEETLKSSKEHSQENCDLCGKYLLVGKWLRLAKCRCALCGVCVEKTITYTTMCPVCGDAFQKRDVKPVVANDPRRGSDVANSDGSIGGSGLFSQQDIEDQKYQCELYTKMRQNASLRVVFEFGNSASPGMSSKTSYITWIKEVRREGKHKDTTKGVLRISKVDFNINPGYTKPTRIVTSPNVDKKWAFEYSMGRAFPCHMTVHFAGGGAGRLGVNFPKLILPYCVSDEKVFTRRLVVDVPRGKPQTRCKAFCIDAMEEQVKISNFWVWNFGSANDKKMTIDVVPPVDIDSKS